MANGGLTTTVQVKPDTASSMGTCSNASIERISAEQWKLQSGKGSPSMLRKRSFSPTILMRNQFHVLQECPEKKTLCFEQQIECVRRHGHHKNSLIRMDCVQHISEDAEDYVDEIVESPSDSVKPDPRKHSVAWIYIQKGIVSGAIYMLGEAIACGLLYRDGRIGLHLDAFLRYSVLHSTLIGMFVNGPLLHLFFELVDRYVKCKSHALNVVLKVLVDQVVWGCLWNFCYILLMNIATDSPGFGYCGEGLGWDFVLDLCKGVNSAFWKAIHWRLHAQLLQEGLKMLPMDIICYWLVPLRLRSLWVVSVDVFWVTILSQYD